MALLKGGGNVSFFFCACMKPRILVIVDVPGWALERTADNVMRRLAGRYDFRKAFNTNRG